MIDTRKKEKKEMDKKMKETETKAASAGTELKAFMIKFNEQKEQFEAELDSKQESLEKATKDLTLAQKMEQELKSKVDSQAKESEALQTEVKSKEKENVKVQNKLAEVNHQLNSLKESQTKVKADAEKELKQFEKQAGQTEDKLKKELAAAKTKAEQVDTIKKTHSQEKDDLKCKFDAEVKKQDKLKAQLMVLNQNKAKSDKIQERESELSMIQSQIEDEQKRIDNEKKRVETSQKAME